MELDAWAVVQLLVSATAAGLAIWHILFLRRHLEGARKDLAAASKTRDSLREQARNLDRFLTESEDERRQIQQLLDERDAEVASLNSLLTTWMEACDYRDRKVGRLTEALKAIGELAEESAEL